MKHLLRNIVLFVSLFSAGKSFGQCQAAFTYTNAGNAYTFTDASTTSSGTISTWFWTFGDLSAPSTAPNPQHTYTACGMYVVTLNIFTSSFCSSSFSDTILVNGGTTPGFTATVDTTTGNVNFQATPASPLLTYNWTYGDSNTGTGIAPSHQYATAGTYNVCLVVADTGGICSDTFCSSVVVTIAPPSCNATFTNTTFANVQTFNATPVNINWNYFWDFGDASPIANGVITTHSYTTPGTYTVCLTVVDSAANCTSTFCDTVIIPLQSNCPVTFTNLALGATETFTTTPLSIFNTYSWDYGDGGPPGTGTISTHTYTVSGTYTVCVTMTTPQSCTSTFCDTVQIIVSGIADYGSRALQLTSYPNPFGESTTISYTLENATPVQVIVYDLLGNEVAVLADEKQAAGMHRIDWNAAQAAPGTYLLRIRTDKGIGTQLITRN